MPTSETHAHWETFYREKPVWAIGWLEHPDDWLRQLITDGTIRKGTALDLGCGAGDKSVYLAKNGFSVTGVDISLTALREAKALAQRAGATVEFRMADAANLVILKKPFTFVLDFSTFHIISEDVRTDYLNEIFRLTKPPSTRHSGESATPESDPGRSGIASQLFLHVFSKRDPNHTLGFFRSDTTKEITYAFDKTDIDRLFGSHFKIVQSQPSDFTINNKKLYFDEYLMERL
ncbi:MAG: class I SAM-dependent methyltransferase [Patescibacteria group bacterium]